MAPFNKVIWSEGLFLRPQHFQQQDRYFERFVETRCHALIAHSWGMIELDVDRDLLSIGKFGLRRATGVFPDGTPFRMPDDDPLPAPVDVGTNLRDQIAYLALPLRRPGSIEADRAAGGDGLGRHDVVELEARDASATSGDLAVLEVGSLRTRLLFAGDVTQAYACVPIVHVVECRSDRHVVLDESFIPTVLRVGAAERLTSLTTELLGLLKQRGDELAGFAMSTGRGAAAEFADYLMLQVVNRYEPLVAHFAASGSAHPEELFRVCVSLTGELATFATTSRRPPAMGPYRHDQLRESFGLVIPRLREYLTFVRERRAIPIPLEAKKFGIFVGTVGDRTLFSTAAFVLAARADVPAEELRRRFPNQLKIGPVDKIRDLVNLQLPGVPVSAVPVAPRQIPYHAGSVYFELDQSHELWTQIKGSGVIALQVPGDFPGLELEFWAIRG